MNKRDVILDFTPLLDVIMILLFMFMMSARSEVSGIRADKEELESKAAELEAELTAANKREEEYKLSIDEMAVKIEEYERLISDYEQANELLGRYMIALNEFENGGYVRITLTDVVSENDWKVAVSYKDTVKTIPRGDKVLMREEVKKFLSEKGLVKESVVICEFEYDGSQPGTNSAYDDIEAIFGSLKTDYSKFIVQIRDISS